MGKEAGPLAAQPLPLVPKLAASRVADSAAVDPSPSPNPNPNPHQVHLLRVVADRRGRRVRRWAERPLAPLLGKRSHAKCRHGKYSHSQ